MELHKTIPIDEDLYNKLLHLGIIHDGTVRCSNAGKSNYAKHIIQPWSIWIDWDLNPWDADIVKRILRDKGENLEEIKQNRVLDYLKIIHICRERLRQIAPNLNTSDYV